MTQGVRITLLTGHLQLAPVLAAWHYAEWGHLYSPDTWSLANAVREFETMAAPGARDLTWLAFDGDTHDADALLGSVSLLASDDLPGFEHLGPWLASLFVTRAARGRGVAAALIDALLRAARAAADGPVYLFTSGQQRFWADRGWCFVADADAGGQPVTVMARSTHPRAARRATCSQWCADPDHGGAYSHLRLGATVAERRRLAGEILPGLWFAGEATSAEYPATMHGAWFSGERAAAQVLADPSRARVAVVGAGLAGLAAARTLRGAGRGVVVLESKAIAGGRIVVDRSTGAALPLGGAWLHGTEGHPLRECVSAVREDWDRPAFFVAGFGILGAEDAAAVTAAYTLLHEAFAAAEPGSSVAAVLAATLASSTWRPVVRDAVTAWITAECAGLYGAPLDDMPANGGFEPYALPGGDHLVTSDLGALAERLAEGLDLRRRHRVGTLRRDGGHWVVDEQFAVDAVIVSVPIGVLGAGRLTFTPGLPDDVRIAIAGLGAGPVVKIFALFDEAWWPAARPIRLTGGGLIGTITDVSAATGRPTLACFAVGDAARSLEALTEHELCRVVDRELAAVGLNDWGLAEQS